MGDLRDAVVLNTSDEQLGKLNGIVVDPQERRLCYFVVESGDLRPRTRLIPAGFARMERDRKALYLDVDSSRVNECEEFRSDRLPSFSDEDLITALFSPRVN